MIGGLVCSLTKIWIESHFPQRFSMSRIFWWVKTRKDLMGILISHRREEFIWEKKGGSWQDTHTHTPLYLHNWSPQLSLMASSYSGTWESFFCFVFSLKKDKCGYLKWKKYVTMTGWRMKCVELLAHWTRASFYKSLAEWLNMFFFPSV